MLQHMQLRPSPLAANTYKCTHANFVDNRMQFQHELAFSQQCQHTPFTVKNNKAADYRSVTGCVP